MGYVGISKPTENKFPEYVRLIDSSLKLIASSLVAVIKSTH